MIVWEERNRLIEAIEGYMDERIRFGKFFDIIEVILFGGGTQDATVLFIADELDERIRGEKNDTIISGLGEWSYYQRLLLILKSGTEVTYSLGIYKEGYYPFRNFADIKKVYKSCEGFKKKKYPKKLYEYFGEPKEIPFIKRCYPNILPLSYIFLIFVISNSFAEAVKRLLISASIFLAVGIVLFALICIKLRFSEEYYFKKRGKEGNAYFVTFKSYYLIRESIAQ